LLKFFRRSNGWWAKRFFRDMARVYMTREPPQSAMLLEYGHGLAGFLESFEPVAKLPYLPDVARIERAWLDAFHAADAEPLDPKPWRQSRRIGWERCVSHRIRQPGSRKPLCRGFDLLSQPRDASA
jgi:hypothetical protein